MYPNNFGLHSFFLLFLATLAKSELLYRLPDSTLPISYTIQLDPQILEEEFSFIGKSSVVFKVIKPTNLLILHKAKNLIIMHEYTQVLDEAGHNYPVIQQLSVPDREIIKFKVDENLQVGSYSLKLLWKGHSNDFSYTGFYRAVDYDHQNNSRYLAVTNLQATKARSVFPCWDEPGYRASFEISVKHPNNYTALSNMPRQSVDMLINSEAITTFRKSPPISSFQVCVVVADYIFLNNDYGNLTVFTKKNNLEFLNHLMMVQEKIIPKIEQYTGIPYVFPKLDIVTIPQFVRASVAESYPGLITYNAKKVKLISKGSAMVTYPTKLKISEYAIHQVLQQWLESLVSPVWWNDFWFTRGISLCLMYKFLDQLYPNLEATNFEIIDVFQFLFVSEALARFSPPPLGSVPKNNPSINEKFNIINNMRSFVITQMLEFVVTKDVFQAGLHHFLKNNKLKSVTTDDFWSSLQSAYDQKFISNSFDIKETMDPWLFQRGFPILKMTRDYENGLVTISQSNAMSSLPNVTWNIPITYATRSQPDFTSTTPITWIRQSQTNITLDGIDAKDWIILNVHQRSYYKVVYDIQNLKLISNYLTTKDFNRIHPINRARIIDDVYDAYETSDSFYEVAIHLICYLRRETNHMAWLSGTQLIEKVMKSTNIKTNYLFKRFIGKITKNIISDIGMLESEDDSSLVLRLKRAVLGIYCQFYINECKPTAYQIYNLAVTESSEIMNMNAMYPWALCNVFGDFNPTDWDKFFASDFPILKEYQNEKFTYLHCTNSSEVMEKYLNEVIDNADNEVDVVKVFENILNYSRRHNILLLLRFFVKNYDRLRTRFLETGQKNVIPSIIKNFVGNIDNSAVWEKFISSFIKPRSKELNREYPVFKRDVMSAISSYTEKNNYKNDFFKYTYENMIQL